LDLPDIPKIPRTLPDVGYVGGRMQAILARYGDEI
jgi:hypothetical protein